MGSLWTQKRFDFIESAMFEALHPLCLPISPFTTGHFRIVLLRHRKIPQDVVDWKDLVE
jgi:hypothetical protein